MERKRPYAHIVRKELAIRRENFVAEGIKATIALEQARKEMNDKYGHDWRSNKKPQKGKRIPNQAYPTSNRDAR
jgi:hypothetical protein